LKTVLLGYKRIFFILLIAIQLASLIVLQSNYSVAESDDSYIKYSPLKESMTLALAEPQSNRLKNAEIRYAQIMAEEKRTRKRRENQQ
jgi:hypothetical protein